MLIYNIFSDGYESCDGCKLKKKQQLKQMIVTDKLGWLCFKCFKKKRFEFVNSLLRTIIK